jgi:hypothetical protein
LGRLEAINGLLFFGLSAGAMFAIMNRLIAGRLHRELGDSGDGLSHVLQFADLDPADCQETWNPFSPYGRTPDQLIMTPEWGKKVWSILLRQRQRHHQFQRGAWFRQDKR